MDSLSDFGCFAYYFNPLIFGSIIQSEDVAHYPLINTFLVVIGGALSLLASKLLLRTVDLQFSEVVGGEGREQLIERAPEKRSSVLNLPALLQRCRPHTCWGNTLYVVFMVCIVIALVRDLMWVGLALRKYMTVGAESGWGGVWMLFAVGLLVGSSLSVQTMEGVHCY